MSSHPAGKHIGVDRAAVWYGREVEGQLAKGEPVPTVFIDAVPHPNQFREIVGRLEWKELHHIFLTENFSDWDWFADNVLPVLDSQPEQLYRITIGTAPERLPFLLGLDFIHRCTLMVRVDMKADWIHKLRPQDQITVGVPYKLTTWLVSDGVRTEPDDYLDDKL